MFLCGLKHTPPLPITSLIMKDNPDLVITNHLLPLQQLELVELQGCAITTPPLFSNATKTVLNTLRLDDNPVTTITTGMHLSAFKRSFTNIINFIKLSVGKDVQELSDCIGY